MVSEVLESARGWLGLYIVVVGPAMLSFWLPVHGGRALWRKLGGAWGYVAGLSCYGSLAALTFAERGQLLAIDFGGSPWRVLSGALLLAGGLLLRRSWALRLPLAVLLGVPELFPRANAAPLTKTGPYAHVRHPRYLELLISLSGLALIADFGAGYAAVAASGLLIALVIPLEERELVERFGHPYVAYREQVPALVPRWRPEP